MSDKNDIKINISADASRFNTGVNQAIQKGEALKANLDKIKAAHGDLSEADKYIASLTREAATLGMTERQMKMYQAATIGVSGADMDAVNILTGKIEAYERQTAMIEKVSGALIGLAKMAATAAIALAAVVVKSAITQATEAEQAQLKLEAALKATGHAAGLTKLQINEMADAMSQTTQFDDESIRNASALMLTFRNVQGATFTEGIALAADLSAMLGQDLNSSVMMLGKALNEPEQALSALTRSGVQFSESQKEQIKYFAETNQLAAAQAIILGEVRNQVGGTAKAMNSGMAKASRDLTKAWDEMAESIGRNTVVGEWWKSVMGGLTALFSDIKGAIEGTSSTLYQLAEDTASLLKYIPGMYLYAAALEEMAKAGKSEVQRTSVGKIQGLDAQKAADGAAAQQEAQAIEASNRRIKAAQEELDRAMKASATAAKAYQKDLQGLLNTLDNTSDSVGADFYKNLNMLHKEYEKGGRTLEPYQKRVEALIGKTEFAKNLKKEEIAQEKEMNRALDEAIKQQDEMVKAYDKRMESNERLTDTLQGELDLLGMAERDRAIEVEMRKLSADATEDQANAVKKLAGALYDEKKAHKAIEDAQKAYEKMNDEINRGLTDALMRGWESGKGFAENAIDTIKNMFKTLVLRPTISAVLSPVSSAISAGMGSLGIPGTANAAGSIGGAVNTAGSIYNMSSGVVGNTMSGLTSGATTIGSVLGASGANVMAASTYGTAVGSSQTAMLLAQETGLTASTTGLTGALAAVPVWGWVAAAAALMFLSNDDPTPPSGLLATLNPDPANLPDYKFDRKSGAFSDGAYAESAFGQIGATEAFAYSGESAQKYLDMVASLDNTLATYLSPEAITRVSTELQAKTYGSEGEGWLETALPNMIKDRFTATFAEVNPELTAFLDSFSGTSEEIIAFGGSLLEVDKSLQDTSASTRLFGEVLDWVKIEDAARSGENVVQTFQRLSAEFALTNQIADMMGHDASTAFGSVGLASESARAALISAAGGLDALAAKTTSFFNKYYSDAERQQASARYSLAVVNDGFANMGLTVPSTMAEFRNLAEAQDLSTEAGRSTYLALMDLADAFATVSAAGGAAAVGLGQAANAIITANQSIGGNYVNNNNLAIGQAANAPIYDQALKEVNARSAALVSGTQVQFGTATDPKLNQEVAGWLAGYRTGGYMTPSAEQTQILRNLSLIPAHASGGLADRGWALVGEQGPELVNFSDPGRVYTADQTRAVFSANDEWDYRQTSGASAIDLSALVNELQQLRQELAEAQYAIARNTRDTAKHMERWDSDGMPEVRAA
ncbi:MAG: phage tail length tape measure family protein [Gammaproteobacteria bacterium]|nr:phage tail length tape measure family protein [Gammaproteobacteria bacterium]MBU1731023.1 phage tail length tape measure family protein [Gammaproteobacteria bacterium]MBU1893683.1 phage tail length tape measure family protein [Gammaproteobacteria bacterium]